MLLSVTKLYSSKSTGCPGSKFAILKSFYSETVLVRPQDGKAKMCLRDIHFCLHLELFVYKKFKNMKYEHNFQHCFHGLEVRGWTAMLKVPGSRLTQV